MKNSEGGYHGYWASDFDDVNENFGSEDDLHELIAEAHARDIWIMVDVVCNHMTCNDCYACVGCDGDLTTTKPFDSPEYFHDLCQIQNWDNQEEVENCRLANLPDLDQDHPFVRETLINWIVDIQSKYDFDGFRMDTVPEVSKDFWDELQAASGHYIVGEVFQGNTGYVADYQNYLSGVFSYPLFFVSRGVFAYGGSMRDLENHFQNEYPLYRDPGLLGVFTDNHDNARFLNVRNDLDAWRSFLTFSLTVEGIPCLYYGGEQDFNGGDDPLNREIMWPDHYNTGTTTFKHVKAIMDLKKSSGFGREPQVQRYADDEFYAFSRGDVLIATTNVGTNGNAISRSVSYLPESYVDGTKLCNVLYSGDAVVVADGAVPVTLLHGESKVYHIC